MRNDQKITSMLGLAQRAGKIHSGATQVEQDIRRGKSKLVIVASDASENTMKDFKNSCQFYSVPIEVWGDKGSLGHTIGKPMRTVISIIDQGFADRIKELLLGRG